LEDLRQRLETVFARIEQLGDLEVEHYGLVARDIAGAQLSAALTAGQVVRVTGEILVNFAGVGSYVIFAVDEERQVLFPVAGEALAWESLQELTLPGSTAAAEPMPQAMREAIGLRRPWSSADPIFCDGSAMMYFPLVSGTRLTGVVRIDGLLLHKQSFALDDLALFEVLSERSGRALEFAWIRAHAPELPFGRVEFESLMVA
jgi:hypothetical protein